MTTVTQTMYAVAAFVVFAPAMAAQGSVSMQGFGYPTGQLSTRAQGTAGALSEIDSRSPLNPAALVIGVGGQAYAQYDPELRNVTGPNGSSHTTTPRFPNFGFALPYSTRVTFGASISTLLDRTWTTTSKQVLTIGTDTATTTQTYSSDGGITDLQVAMGYRVNERLRVGLGAHGYTGSNRISLQQQFADTLRYRSLIQRMVANYSGTALSAGLEFDILRTLNVAMSGRLGGEARMRTGDTLLSKGHIPDRYAASLSFGGIPQTLVAVRFAHEKWSALQALSVSGARATDANDVSVGFESAGPKAGERSVLIRLGARRRTLPFDVGTTAIQETSFGGGLGIPVGLPQLGDRGTFDVSMLRNTRTNVGGVKESAYNFSFGVRIQP